MKPNLLNPRCPSCNGITQKLGTLPTLSGKYARYRCTTCGKTFTGDKILGGE